MRRIKRTKRGRETRAEARPERSMKRGRGRAAGRGALPGATFVSDAFEAAGNAARMPARPHFYPMHPAEMGT